MLPRVSCLWVPLLGALFYTHRQIQPQFHNSALLFSLATALTVTAASAFQPLSFFSHATRKGALSGPIDAGGSDDASKWEAMYYGTSKATGESTSVSNGSSWGLSDLYGSASPCPVSVVSWDLDDTLWPTDEVIGRANNALQAHLEVEHPEIVKGAERLLRDGGYSSDDDTITFASKRASGVVPALMKKIHADRRRVDPTVTASPTDLTELRKAALGAAVAAAGDGLSGHHPPSVLVNSCFDFWAAARHTACEALMFPGAAQGIQQLHDAGVLQGAITNGNADIRALPSLSPFFAFSITSEAVGIAKPSPVIFGAAVEAAGLGSSPVGRRWVHIGDDFAKDCVAAREAEMRTIWIRPGASDGSQDEVGAESLIHDAEVEGGLESLPLVDGVYALGSIGSGDYLARMVTADGCDAVCSSAAAAAARVLEWHSQGSTALEAAADADENLSLVGVAEEATQATEGAGQPAKEVAEEILARLLDGRCTSQKDCKFCVECGVQLPRTAKFCFDCGSKQP